MIAKLVSAYKNEITASVASISAAIFASATDTITQLEIVDLIISICAGLFATIVAGFTLYRMIMSYVKRKKSSEGDDDLPNLDSWIK